MTDAFAAGSILMEEGTRMPGSLLIQGESDSNGWAAVTNVRAAFDKEVKDAGWNYFFMAGEIKSTVFGFDRQKALSAALKRIIADVKLQNCNSCEITAVTSKSFLNMLYVIVSAHPRHLQRGLVFSQ